VDRFEEIFKHSRDAAKVIHKEMQIAVRSRTGSLVDSLQSVSRLGGDAVGKDGDIQMDDY
jgi:hypothetical protein